MIKKLCSSLGETYSTFIGLILVGIGAWLIHHCKECSGEALYARCGLMAIGVYCMFSTKSQRSTHLDWVLEKIRKKLPLVVGFMVAFLMWSCGTMKPLFTERIVQRVDTIKVIVAERAVSSRIDTLRLMGDTVSVYNADSLLYLQYWRNAYGELMAECRQRKHIQYDRVIRYDTVRTVFRPVATEKAGKVWMDYLPWVAVGLLSLGMLVLGIRR